LPGGTAIIESARVIGLSLLAPERRPKVSERRTHGLGELLLAAIDAGAREIAVGLGGTATVDAGVGMAEALGVTFADGVDVTGRDPRVARVRILALTDVDSPLLGEQGAARVFGPQKGASPEDVARIEAAFTRLTNLARDPGAAAGDGAAGGIGYGLRVFAGATRARGIDYVMSAVNFEERLNGVDLALTGEGKLDAQTARGKVVSGVIAACGRRGIPVIALAGTVEGELTALLAQGLTSAHSLVSAAVSPEAARARAASLLETLTAEVVSEPRRART